MHASRGKPVLAAAAEVTESYISQLLTRKKLPPVPSRTDIYDKIGKFLKLPSGKLANLADHQRKEELKRNLVEPWNHRHRCLKKFGNWFSASAHATNKNKFTQFLRSSLSANSSVL
jgi:hypothetical protein